MAELKQKTLSEVRSLEREPVDAETYATAVAIVDKVRSGGKQALLEEAERLGDIKPGETLVYDREALEAAAAKLSEEERGILERTAARIRLFAEGQRGCLKSFETDIPGG